MTDFDETQAEEQKRHNTRAADRREILTRMSPRSTRKSFVDLDRDQLKEIADELEKGKSALKLAPQVIVKRVNGEVQTITYTAGNFDFGKNPLETVKCDVNALIKTSLEERKSFAEQSRIRE